MAKGRMPKSPHSAEYQRFLQLLQQARLDAGMTQAEVAEKLGRPQSFISKCESGERRMDVVEFLYFCRAVEADAEALFCGMT